VGQLKKKSVKTGLSMRVDFSGFWWSNCLAYIISGTIFCTYYWIQDISKGGLVNERRILAQQNK